MTLGDDKSGINGVVRSHLTMSSLSPRPRPRGISRVISGRASRTGVTRSRRNEDFFSSWKSKASTQLSYPLAFFSLPFLFHFFLYIFFSFHLSFLLLLLPSLSHPLLLLHHVWKSFRYLFSFPSLLFLCLSFLPSLLFLSLFSLFRPCFCFKKMDGGLEEEEGIGRKGRE